MRYNMSVLNGILLLVLMYAVGSGRSHHAKGQYSKGKLLKNIIEIYDVNVSFNY